MGTAHALKLMHLGYVPSVLLCNLCGYARAVTARGFATEDTEKNREGSEKLVLIDAPTMSRVGIRIGTSGWHYAHWVGPFYPEGTPAHRFLPYYMGRFDTVEINNTFYQLPETATLAAWRDTTPARFLFATKASRYITHMKKLKDPEQSLGRFFDAVETLQHKLGPILFQLPPRWGVDPERLERFLHALPPAHRYVFEFRDESWFHSRVYELLADHGVAFCIYDLAGRRTPVEVTTDFAYVRLHGPGGAYQGSYDGRTLDGWARRFINWRDRGTAVYCYFDNDQRGYAALDALRLIEMIRRRRARAQ